VTHLLVLFTAAATLAAGCFICTVLVTLLLDRHFARRQRRGGYLPVTPGRYRLGVDHFTPNANRESSRRRG
jgi:hypothetical protein